MSCWHSNMQEDERKGKKKGALSYFKDTYLKSCMTLLFTFNWSEFSHMSTPNAKGGWKWDINAKKFVSS